MRMQVQSLASLSGLRIRRCRELLCRLQMWPGSGVAVIVAQASSYSSNWTHSLETSICHMSAALKRQNIKKKKKKRKKEKKKKRKIIYLPNGTAISWEARPEFGIG